MMNCGLLSEKNVSVPLKSISVEVLVQDHVATVSSTLQYVNEEERPLEALFVFPLPADAAVCHFSAKIGEQEIVAEVQDRETARDRYDDAVSSGQQAFLLEESAESPDVFRLSVGCLSAGQNAAVTIIYVTELAVQANHSLRFCLPAVLSPRYTPAGSAAGIVSEISSGAVPYTLTLSVHVSSPKPISKLESNCTLGPLVFLHSDHTQATIRQYGRHYESRERSTNVESTKDTLLLVLKSLPMGCYFNIYGFGSDFESFFPQSVEYNQDTMDQALKRVKEMQADMGGTEILQPLKHIYSQPCYPDHPRQVGNTKEVLDLVKSHAHSHRCFSLGIGEGASAALITGMAREGSGHAQFITDTDRMQPKVMQSLRFALQPAVLNISMDWTLPDDVTVDALSPPINVLFQGQRTLIYSSGGSVGTVTVKYSLKDQPVTNQLHFCLKPTEETQLSIHRLVARTLIRSLEQKERSGAADVEGIRSRIVELSVQAGVSSVHTAFIAVNKDSRQTVKGPLVKRRVRTCERSMLMYRSMRDAQTAQPETSKVVKFDVTVEHSAEVAHVCGVSRLPHDLPCFLLVEASTVTPDELHKILTGRGTFEDHDKVVRVVRPVQQPYYFWHTVTFVDQDAAPELQKDPLLQLVSLQKASGCWDLDATLADVFGKTEDELTNQKPAQVDGSVWATLLALIWLYGCKIEQQVEWQFVAMKAASWIGSQKVGDLSQCVCVGNVLLGCQVTKETLGI
ncbi:von Willebrand factor A domain-containing protein 5A-like [Sinocyclocheilus grahami]|uniref:von Willebrand factor A domain-containing protein 5A-like n=1 Tax=Sinocyclocheilus grahami TaxID=75366 RepID=UPI0007ACB3E4|nr:PREDICTED: von Willebrand factor A domain-containing protein 5A-like [Sinocyclocheilus grahami]